MGAMNHADTIDQDAAVNFRNTLIRIIRSSLGLPETVALPMADALAKGMCSELGGLYITKREIRGSRDEAVRRDFTGRNHRDVCRKHEISRATLYRIIGSVAGNL
jgi:hypothetical protein